MKDIKNLTYGVDRLFIENKRFNTTLISVNFYLPLNKREIAQYSLLSSVMASSCKAYPEFSELNLRQKELYSTVIGATSEKVGDLQLIKFYSTYLNNDVVLEDVETQVHNLLLEIIFNPLLENGGFKASEVNREKRLILEKIKSLINEKRGYAINKTISEMFKGTAYAVNKLGDKKDIEEITPKELYEAYLYMLKNAYVRIQVTAKEYNGSFDKAFLKAISPFRENKDYTLIKNTAKKNNGVNEITEKAPITQAKLCICFTSEEEIKSAAVNVFSDILGGGPYSLLFSNVREKMSLCYYCAARNKRNKGFLMVDSGVEQKNIVKAKEQILIELKKLQKGEFDEELINTSKRAILEALKSNNDSDMVIDSWYSFRRSDELYSPEELSKQIEAVTKQEIINIANSFKLDTVFTLVPEGENDN